nr:ribonuclease H-like domain-containing protein [Tanacetum cinerariifolium]
MITRFRVGTHPPPERLNLHVSSILPLPKLYTGAFNDPNLQNAMYDEYNAFIKNNTWTLVPRPTNANIVQCIWLFCHNYLANGTLSRYKARLVANGSTQLSGIDVDETFRPFVKPDTIRTPLGFQDSTNPLQRSLYGRAEHMDRSTGPKNQTEPNWTDRTRPNRKYAIEILKQACMVSCNSSRNHVDTESKLGLDGDLVSDLTIYQSHASALQFLTFTHPNISHAVQQVCLHMHDLRETHFLALKQILRYARGTLDHGSQLFSSSTNSLVAYSDVDCPSFPTTRRSTSGYCVFIGNNLLSWSSTRQPSLSRSSVEAECRGVTNVIANICWLRN